MHKRNLKIGRRGEEAAAHFLEESGYLIIARNFKSPLGEIDIIAKDNDTVCFIEVKTRSSARFGSPKEAVSAFKRRQICKSALIFLKSRRLLEGKARFDVVSILEGRVELIKNAFELDAAYSY